MSEEPLVYLRVLKSDVAAAGMPADASEFTTPDLSGLVVKKIAGPTTGYSILSHSMAVDDKWAMLPVSADDVYIGVALSNEEQEFQGALSKIAGSVDRMLSDTSDFSSYLSEIRAHADRIISSVKTG